MKTGLLELVGVLDSIRRRIHEAAKKSPAIFKSLEFSVEKEILALPLTTCSRLSAVGTRQIKPEATLGEVLFVLYMMVSALEKQKNFPSGV